MTAPSIVNCDTIYDTFSILLFMDWCLFQVQ